MANSYIEYTSGLTATTYDVPFNVLSITDVNVKGYNGTTWSDLTVSSRDASTKTVTLDVAPSAFQKIRVWRNTGTTQLVDFQNGSRLSESDLDTAYQQGLFVAQEVSENASTEVEGIGPQGPQGIQGVAGNDGADGVSSTVALTESFESSEITITAGNTEVTHGLGGAPKIVKLVVRCKDAANTQGYSVGDEVEVINAAGYNQMTYYSNATKCGVSINASFYILNKTAGVSPTTVNTAHWKLVFRAFA
jgi:hypothetical protein